MKLCECPVGVPMIMVDLGEDAKFSGRINELGLRPGTRFTVTQKAAFGGRVLFVHGTRLAVDRGFAKKASVRPCIQFARKQGVDAERAALEVAISMGVLPEGLADRVQACGLQETAAISAVESEASR